jgi:hypothetical protein
MSYIISYSDPAKASYPITVVDNTIYNGVGAGSLKLVGKNYPAYGQPVAENFIHLLENFASSTPPDNPVEGQLWYDNATQKLRLNNGTANTANWKPVNGLYQQSTEPIDAVIGDMWVDTIRNQIFIHNGIDFSTLVGPDYTGGGTGIVAENIASTNNPGVLEKPILKFDVNGITQAVLVAETFQSELSIEYGINQNLIAGLNLKDGLILNGIADSANSLRQSGIKIRGESFMRKDTAQTINGQFTVGIDGNSLLIGSDPTFILERTINGSNANFLNLYRNYGTFSFNIKDSNFRTVKVLDFGGGSPTELPQVNIPSVKTSISKDTGALVVGGGAGFGGDVYVGGNLYFSNRIGSTLTVATIIATSSTQASSTTTGALIVNGGAGIGQNLYVGGNINIGVNGAFYDSNGRAGSQGDVLVSQGNKVTWVTLPYSGSDTNVASNLVLSGYEIIQGSDNAVSTNTGALKVSGGVGVGRDIFVGGNVTATNAYISNSVNASTGTFSRFRISATTPATSTSTGAIVVEGGVGIGGDLYVGGNIVANKLTIQLTTVSTTLVTTDDVIKTTNTTNATSTLTGAMTVAGGVGIGRDVLVGNQIYVKTGANISPNPVAGLWPVSTQTYVLPTATGSVLGGVKIGSSLNIASDVIDINTATLMTTATYAQFVTTTATETRLGGIIIGSNLSVTGNATVSIATATNSVLGLVSVDLNTGIAIQQGRLSLSTATNVYIGGVRLGENVYSRTNGTLYIDTSTLLVAEAVTISTTATNTRLGAVKIGSNINISSSGTISVPTGANYALPIATTSTLGGVKQNASLPAILVDAGGELRSNVFFFGSTGTNATTSWNTLTSYYEVSYSSAPANTGYNVAYDTVVTQDNLQARVTTSGVAQIKAVTTAMSVFWSAQQIISGQLAMSPTVNTGSSLSTSTWTSIGTANNLSSGGDTIIAHVQDQNRGALYRVTYIHTAGVSSASAVIERLI